MWTKKRKRNLNPEFFDKESLELSGLPTKLILSVKDKASRDLGH